MKMRRYTKELIINNRFYQMPKFLFEGKFRKLSNDARVLYSLLRDRHDLSLVNNWVNEKGEVYLIYTRENMAEMLGCSIPTARKAINQLTEYGLIEEERQGLNKPNLIYLTAISVENTRTEKIFQSREKEPFSQEGKNLSPNDTKYNETEFNDTEYIHLPAEDDFIFFYKETFKAYKGIEHMRVKRKDYEYILYCIGEIKSYDVTKDEWIEAVGEHFETLPENNNGNILAFLKATKRYFDVDLI